MVFPVDDHGNVAENPRREEVPRSETFREDDLLFLAVRDVVAVARLAHDPKGEGGDEGHHCQLRERGDHLDVVPRAKSRQTCERPKHEEHVESEESHVGHDGGVLDKAVGKIIFKDISDHPICVQARVVFFTRCAIAGAVQGGRSCAKARRAFAEKFGLGRKFKALTYAILMQYEDKLQFTHFLEDIGQKKRFLGPKTVFVQDIIGKKCTITWYTY